MKNNKLTKIVSNPLILNTLSFGRLLIQQFQTRLRVSDALHYRAAEVVKSSLLLLALLITPNHNAYAEPEEVTKKVQPSHSHQMAPLYLGFGWGLRLPDGRVPIVYNPANVPPPFADQIRP